MKKVLLVSANTLRAPYPVPPLGLCLLAGTLSLSWKVRVFDALAADGEALAGAVREFAPDYVGLGVRNIDDLVMEGVSWFVDEVRDRVARPLRSLSAAPLILGGSGFSIFPGELLARLGGDYGVVGEAEEALPALLAALGSGADPLAVPGVVSPAQPWPRRPAPPAPPTGLSFAQIDRWVDYAPYRERGAYPIQTKRGCARHCIYCSYPQLEGRRFRRRSPASVVDEIEQARGRLGDVTFEFVDSVFNDPPGHAEGVCREIARRGLSVRLRAMGINPAGVGPELLGLMAAAGFAQMDSTPDSASPAMLRSLGKGFTREDLERAATAVRAAGLPTMWFFLLGGPGETERTLAETFDFVDRFVSPEDMVHIGEGLRIYPRTGLHETALREGVVRQGESLLEPRFYVSPALGRERLLEIVRREIAGRPNCVRAAESTPPPALLREAVRQRRERGLEEPMFRTLLRLRRQGPDGAGDGRSGPQRR